MKEGNSCRPLHSRASIFTPLSANRGASASSKAHNVKIPPTNAEAKKLQNSCILLLSVGVLTGNMAVATKKLVRNGCLSVRQARTGSLSSNPPDEVTPGVLR
jgi:hypothetical protein